MSSRPSDFECCEVFVVDDEPQLRRSICRAIDHHGMKSVAYESAEDFLACVEATAGQPRCVVSDLRLPGLSGLDLKRELLVQGIDLPVILLTGFADDETVGLAESMGFYTVMEKPFAPFELVDTIRRAIAAHRRKTG